MNISVIGTGYVGLVTGACLADSGLNVLCADIDAYKIKGLRKGRVSIYEPGLDEIVRKNLKNGNLEFTTDMAKAIEHAEVVFIAVGTPALEDGSTDMRHVLNVVDEIAERMDEHKLVISKSTVPIGTGKLIRERIKSRLLVRGKIVEFDVVSNPEFVREGSAVNDFIKPDRIVIGSSSERAIGILKTIYAYQIKQGTPCIVTDIETAEMIKYASNAFLATKLGYINEFANLCELCGADICAVTAAMGLDKRIGPLYMNPGPGFGGSCLTKDLQAVIDMSKGFGYDMAITESVLRSNQRQRTVALKKIKDIAGNLENKTVTVLGLSFKPGTDDIRDSPAIDLLKRLSEEKVRIKAYDPEAIQRVRKEYPFLDVCYCSGMYSACRNSDCIVLMTDWSAFLNIDFKKLRNIVNKPIFVDMRNMFDPHRVRSEGFIYCGIGRKLQ